MRRNYLLLLAIVFAVGVKAQTGKFWIVFTDKNGSPYSISNPKVYLSPRALARRAKYGIPVQYNDLPPNPAYIDSVLAKGFTLLNRSRWFNAISVSTTDTNNMKLVRALPFVQKSQWVYPRVKPKKRTLPKDFATINNKYHAVTNSSSVDTFNSGYSYTQEHLIGVDCLNNMGYRGKGKRIAVIDTRFGRVDTLSAFDTLRTRGQILGTWDFVWEISKVYDTAGTDTHGEEVLSCMVGNLPNNLFGDAMDADYYLLRSEDAYSENIIEDDNWTSAAEYADSAGADVISSSLGYNTFDMTQNSYTYADMNGKFAVASRAATIATEKGLVVCVAAGNEGGSSWQYITSPGDADSILTVGATYSNGSYVNFSSTGPTSDKRIKPDIAAMGVGCALAAPNGSGVSFGSGTSFATPTIAGAVASLWQADTNASNYQIMAAIKQSASQYTHPDTLEGYGIPNFCLAKSILTGIEEHQPFSALTKTYPDPFDNEVTIGYYSSIRQNIRVALFNTVGQMVYHSINPLAAGGSTQITIKGLGNLPSGLYVIVLTDETGIVSTTKVMKR